MSGASMQTHEAEAGGGEATPTDAKPVTPADAKHMQEKCEAAEGGSNAEVVEATLHALPFLVQSAVEKHRGGLSERLDGFLDQDCCAR